MRRYEQPTPHSRFMKEQTQKISMKTSKAPTPDKPMHKTQTLYKQISRRRHSQHSTGSQFMGFLNQYINHLNQPSTKGRSIDVSSSSRESKITDERKDSKLQKISRQIQEQRLLNQKLCKKVQTIQDVLVFRETQLDRLSKKVEKLIDKQNSRRNTNSRAKDQGRLIGKQAVQKYKVSDFMKKEYVPVSSGGEQEFNIDSRNKNYTQCDEKPRRRKSTIVQRSGYSKPLMTEELEHLISQTVGLKTVSNKYKLI